MRSHPFLGRLLAWLSLAVVFAASTRSEAQLFDRLKNVVTRGVSVTFKNNTREHLTLNSSSPGLTGRGFARVGAGQTVTVPGAPGQTWTAVDGNNRTVAQFRATTQPQQSFTIGQGQGRPQPQAPPSAPAPANRGGNAGPASGVNLLPPLFNPSPRPSNPAAGSPSQAPPAGPQPRQGAAPAVANVAGANDTGSRVTRQQANQMVAYHNQKRAEVNSGRVTWSPQIAAFAQKRADDIARTKRFGHLPQGQNPYGENLAQGGSSGAGPGFTVINACEGWYDEKKLMPPGARTMTAPLFNRRVGHYTQMVWRGSTEIGAGIAHYQEGGFNMTVVVCCYNPRGNVMGESIY